MDKEHPRIAVIGAGAIGGVTASFVSMAGWDLELVCKHQEVVDRARSQGLHISGVRGDHHVRLNGVKDVGDLSGPKDVVFLATKATDCTEVAERLLPFLTPNSAVVSLQNGICEDALAAVVGRERVIGCVVGWGATMIGPGLLEVTSDGEFVIGNIDGQADDRLPLIKQMLDAVVPTRISKNIMGELYSKLVVNSCINSLGVITGLELGKLLALRKVRNIFIGIMEEAISVAGAMGLHVEPGGGGKLDYYRFLGRRGWWADFVRHGTIRLIGFKYRRIKSSSLQSLERGRKTEIDYLNGYVVAHGRELQVPTPLNEAVVDVIEEIEAGARKIGIANLDHPAFLNH
jgi:2-dehydropantoate 2-reductase